MTHTQKQRLDGRRKMVVNDVIKYDPDGGYWDAETDTWVKYDDMGTI